MIRLCAVILIPLYRFPCYVIHMVSIPKSMSVTLCGLLRTKDGLGIHVIVRLGPMILKMSSGYYVQNELAR